MTPLFVDFSHWYFVYLSHSLCTTFWCFVCLSRSLHTIFDNDKHDCTVLIFFIGCSQRGDCIFFQRLCEELEYSELLDKAAEYDDPYERMVGIAVSVSFL